MKDINKIEVETTDCYPISKRASVSWQTADARFHFWIDMETREIEGRTCSHSNYPVIYKNPLVERRDPAHFNTRYLDATSKSNAEIIKFVFAEVDRLDLIAKAIAADLAKQAETQKRNAEYQRAEKIRDAAPELLESLRACAKISDAMHNLAVNGHLLNDDVKARMQRDLLAEVPAMYEIARSASVLLADLGETV